MEDYTVGLKRATVLLVEDEAVVALDIANVLRQIGYEVPEILVTGEEAVKAAERLMPDLILMDITLAGDMDGIRAAQEIRKRYDIPLVYLTANADQTTVERARETEPFGYLNKPVSELDLLTNIDTALFKHRMERRLREREERLRLITDNMVDTISQIGQDGTIVYVSPSVERNYGFLPEDLIGHPGTELVHPDDLPPMTDTITRAIKRGEELVTLEYRWRNANGKYRWTESKFRFLYDEGRWKTTIVSSRDITKRRGMEYALKESEERYRMLFELGSDAIFIIENETGRILAANSAASAMYGYSNEELLAMKNTDLSAEPEETRSVTTKTAIDPGKVIFIPLRYHRKRNGTSFPVEITGRFFNLQGRRVHIAAIRDITDRVSSEKP